MENTDDTKIVEPEVEEEEFDDAEELEDDIIDN